MFGIYFVFIERWLNSGSRAHHGFPSGLRRRMAGGGARLSGRGAFRRTAAVLLLVVLAAAVAFVPTAQGQTEVTLVSNTGQPVNVDYTISIGAQPFTTGSVAVLTSVDVYLGPNTDLGVNDIRVRILQDDSGSPGTELVTLGNPAAKTDDGVNTFTAPAGTNLAADTTYYVEVSKYGESGVRYYRTQSDLEDAGRATDWEIGDSCYYKSTSTDASWTISNDLMLIAIKGTTSKPTLHALVVNDGNTDLMLTPGFAPGAETYRVLVANAVGEVTVTSTKSVVEETIEYLDGSDMTLADADTSAPGHQVKLAEGDNVIKVKVTAEDGATTRTYTVTVNRAEANLSADAMLSTLVVNDGRRDLTLTPAFAPGTTSYKVSVANAVDEVTVTPTPNDAAGATFEYLDALDFVIYQGYPEAAISPHVALVIGDSVIKVKVTAEDGATTRTYTVTVNRAEPDTTCRPNSGDLWCGVLTVGRAYVLQGHGYCGTGCSTPFSTEYGQLSDTDFTIGTTTYTIQSIRWGTSAGGSKNLFFDLDALPAESVSNNWILHIGTDSFAVSGATADSSKAHFKFARVYSAITPPAYESMVVVRLAHPPPPPANLRASPGDGEVALSWNAPASGVTRHEYRYKTDGEYGGWTAIPASARGSANQAGFTVKGLVNGTAYTFQVRAVNDVGAGAAAESDPVTPAPPPFVPKTCTLNPGDVWCGRVTVGEVAEASGKTIGYGFHETWHGDGVGGLPDARMVYGVNSYRIDEAMVGVGVATAGDDRILFFSLNRALTATDRARLVLHIGSDRFAFSDAQFESGAHTYHWRNTGLDWSSTSSVTPRLRASPAAPTAVTASAPPRTGGLLEVEWSAPASAPAGSITDYEVKYWKAADPENENRRSRTARTESAGTRLLIYPFLDASTEYELRVRARNAIGWGAWSEVATARTGAKRPTNPIVSLAVVDASGNDIDRITGGETFRYRVKVRELLNHHRSSGRDFTGWGTLGVRGPIAIEYFNDDVRSGCHGETLFLEDFTWETFTTGYWEFDSVEIPADAGPVRLRMGFGCRASHTNAGLPLTGFVTTTSRSFQLGSPVRACLSVADSEGTVTNACPAGEGGARSLKARFVSPPERHDGSGRVKVRVAFSEAIEESPENVGEHGVKVEGGRVTSVRRVDNRPGGGAAGRSAGRSGDGQEDGERVWEFEIEPGSDEDLTMRIDGGRPCDEPGAICTEDGRSLSQGIATTVEGPEPGPPPLTAAFEGIPEAHDGEDAFRFRVAFSEEIGIGFRSMRDASFTVDGGEVTRARRVEGRHDLWRITVEPDGEGDVTVTLPGGRECAVSGAICTRGGDRRRLTNTATATVAGPAVEAAVAPLTASFVQAPAEHDGKTAFKLRIAFSEGISISFRTFRDASLSVSGGSVTKAKRVDRRKDLWEATVKPDSIGDVTVTLEGGRACGTPGAVCTGDGRALSATISTRVLGPPGLSVADAEVDEGPDAALAFVVRLDRAPSSRVTVDYATADGTAKAGSDYTAVSGALTFAAGERAKTVSVAVLDDAHDEGSETLTLTLSNATGAYIEDGTATGTIKNTDHMPKAWLARFGRTVAEQVLDAVGARIEGNSNSPGPARLTLGGHQVVLDASWSRAEDTLLGEAGVLGPDLRETRDLLRAEADDSTAGEISTAGLLMASSFHMASADGGKEDANGRWSLWARGSRSSFSGREDALTLEGDVSTGVMGADYERGRVLAGVALAWSTGEGSYTEADARGEVESTLASVHPYLRYTVSDRLSVWGVLGLGEGGLTLEVENTGGIVERMETDISMGMAAFGARGKLASVAGYDLAIKTDVLFVRTESEAVTGLAAADAQTRRLRLALEGSREVKFESGVLTPSLEIGLRHDGGDAETGSGVELGGGLGWTNAKGLSVEVRARGLIAHEERDYEEWGVSASLALSPGEEGRGVSVRVGSTWGASSSGVGRLWAQRAVAGGEFDPDAGLNAEVGYGLDAWRGLLTPYTGVALTGGGETWRAGARWKLGPAFALNLEATLAEPAGDGEHEAGLVLRGSKRW